MDKFDDASENSIRSGFLSADTEAYTHRKHVSQSVSNRNTHKIMSKCPFSRVFT